MHGLIRQKVTQDRGITKRVLVTLIDQQMTSKQLIRELKSKRDSVNSALFRLRQRGEVEKIIPNFWRITDKGRPVALQFVEEVTNREFAPTDTREHDFQFNRKYPVHTTAAPSQVTPPSKGTTPAGPPQTLDYEERYVSLVNRLCDILEKSVTTPNSHV